MSIGGMQQRTCSLALVLHRLAQSCALLRMLILLLVCLLGVLGVLLWIWAVREVEEEDKAEKRNESAAFGFDSHALILAVAPKRVSA